MWEALFAFHISIAGDVGELRWCPVGQRTMRAFPVILLPPGFQRRSDIVEGAEPACVQALVAESAMEAFDMPVLHRPSRLDMDQGSLPLF